MADNVTTQELEDKLTALADAMGISVKEYTEAGFLDLTTYGQDKKSILARLDAIDSIDADDGVDTIAEKIIAFNKVLSDKDGALQNILELINVNTSNVAGLKTVTDGLRKDVDVATAKGLNNEAALTDLTKAVQANKDSIKETTDNIASRTTSTEAAVNVINGDEDTVGSIANAVKAEQTRAKTTSGATADLNTADKTNLVSAINEIDAANKENSAKIDVLNGDENTNGSIAKQIKDVTGGDISGLSDRVTAVEAEDTRLANIIDDTKDANDNVIKGLATQTSDNAAAILAEKDARVAELEKTVTELKAYSDSKDLKASSLDVNALANKFRSALGLAEKSSDDSL